MVAGLHGQCLGWARRQDTFLNVVAVVFLGSLASLRASHPPRISSGLAYLNRAAGPFSTQILRSTEPKWVSDLCDPCRVSWTIPCDRIVVSPHLVERESVMDVHKPFASP